MIVMKFGGTSVEDAAAIRQVSDIIRTQVHRKPVVVVSAIAEATNQLLHCASLATEGKIGQVQTLTDELRRRHDRIVKELLGSNPETVGLSGLIDSVMDDLLTLSKGLAILGELTPRSIDAFTSVGERLSSAILAVYLNAKGIQAELLSARSFMITDNSFTKAVPLFNEIQKRIPEKIIPHINNGKVVVTQGFIGSTIDGITTTLGRGGSDYSAAIIGAAIGVEEIQIWTDVDGVMTADPSLIKEAKQIPEMTFDEAAELAYFGAKVLHPATVQPAIEKNIPVLVLNSKRPGAGGTKIQKEGNGKTLVKSIAYKEGITVINVRSTRMLMQSGFLTKLFDVFSKHNVSIDVVATSEVTVSLTVDNPAGLDALIPDLENFATVQTHKGKAIVCIVGERIKYTPGIAAQVFSALQKAGINVEVISLGGSDISLTLVINESEIEHAVRALHNAFFS